MNTPAHRPQTCPAGDRLGRSLLPRPGRDTARGGLSAHASTSGVCLPGRQQLPSAFGPGAFQPLSGGVMPGSTPGVAFASVMRQRNPSHLQSAAQRNRLSQASHVRNGARDHRTGWRATECATFRAALDLHRGAV